MNERIKELAREVGLLVYNPEGAPTKLEKFAELIVQECVNSIPLDMDQAEYLRVMQAIKNTFRS